MAWNLEEQCNEDSQCAAFDYTILGSSYYGSLCSSLGSRYSAKYVICAKAAQTPPTPVPPPPPTQKQAEPSLTSPKPTQQASPFKCEPGHEWRDSSCHLCPGDSVSSGGPECRYCGVKVPNPSQTECEDEKELCLGCDELADMIARKSLLSPTDRQCYSFCQAEQANTKASSANTIAIVGGVVAGVLGCCGIGATIAVATRCWSNLQAPAVRPEPPQPQTSWNPPVIHVGHVMPAPSN